VIRHGQQLAIGLRLDVRYGVTAIASKEFPPPHAVEIVPFGKTSMKAEIQFQQCRKYESNSNITFDDGPVKPDKPPNVIK
jgi:hypothetical protein